MESKLGGTQFLKFESLTVSKDEPSEKIVAKNDALNTKIIYFLFILSVYRISSLNILIS